MKYEYMKEYPCNGVKPDLPDDVLVQVRFIDGELNLSGRIVKEWDWSLTNHCGDIKSFRIVDERYKTKHHIPDAGKKIKSDRFERGDKCEVLIYGVDEWLPAKFVGLDPDNGEPIFKHIKGYSRVEDSRPIQAEKNRLIEEYTDKIMRDGNCNGDEMFTVEEAVALMYENDWRPEVDNG